ncbi:pyruvate:ferredoxin (flavodoxin) oxidoreductase [Gilliamella sp. B2776]|uniref:pyruvate:ferredoxin (flavodoxin) oxidoreductase n=1 Tax=unclassified Gilliamella TaxID=2685620 RepID=UPI002269DAE4|nr:MULTISPECIES: pyruvate:ferredoxin (flavodoxin) oxidoreductase [unclassified Gilliamella]MCX8650470.1 pyruvate:ferredoxin (flavodoxin) oxidoreductase [Gilliamella sp. B2779]MCX8654484.1 pyruvate:ferredoxin (flavodoxin) oxidoreductase [Gilliamella sp. B2737]MCX8656775.1 pyruvate:ferredoxin (flavodoxin) oxidoreductase [Gilliamella sp. B2894]MCX8692318.1 pyruvate:ferredoxin (flavodoxin) oxidoreductase [Gilliamella sp. B2776]MCX8694219.1 pyruvate:ferredoxin (flavodoxin) oxidoreductase [Gilliamel
MIISDANSAVSSVAYRANEVIAIYPITPSSSMAEQASTWAEFDKPNVFGDIPRVVEMQSEAGAIATVHGALMTGALATSFTSSQGLLLMIPSLYKIAGELTPFVLHVAARTVATHALSIFGDHSDVMSIRQTGFAMLCSSSVQEAQDLALISQIASFNSRIPFVHFFDGFRTSHEVNKIYPLSDEDIHNLLPHEAIKAYRSQALTPDKPVIRGTSANPDTYFQCREAINSYYDNAYQHVVDAMTTFEKQTGRKYQPFEYYGASDAERIIIIMGSGASTSKEVVDHLLKENQKVGIVIVRLFRPFSAQHLLAVIPNSVKKIAVLDRTKEPGAQAEPLYLDVMTAFAESLSRGERNLMPKIVGGRYGLSSKEFDPRCVLGIFNELDLDKPRPRFTVGIYDDITGLSLPLPDKSIPQKSALEALFYGLGSDGTVSATKNNIKIIGDSSPFYVQGFFVYDSKKAGGLTTSHLRVSLDPIDSPYLITSAHFIGCHQDQFIDKYQIVDKLKDDGIFLLNTPYNKDEIWHRLPKEVQVQLIKKRAHFYIINAAKIARECNLGARINTVMQAAFFHLSDIFKNDFSIAQLKEVIAKSYSSKGQELVENNWKALDLAITSLEQIPLSCVDQSSPSMPPIVPNNAPDFVKTVTATMLAGLGDNLPVSAFPPDGIWPTGTTKWEKRNIAEEIPIWKSELCTQCNHCVVACPHAAIRAKVVEPDAILNAPDTLDSLEVKARDMKGQRYVLQVAPEDCTGCNLCVEVCPSRDRSNFDIKAINMQSRIDNLETQRVNYEFFSQLPDRDIKSLERIDIRTSQLITPLFEYSGACAGCGETPYIKLLTQLYGDHLAIANATGCSSIYGGNLPSTPYTTDRSGRGPAWANSLFEDNAEFALGYRITYNQHRKRALRLLDHLAGEISPEIAITLQSSDATIAEKRMQVDLLREQLKHIDSVEAKELLDDANYLIDKSVWAIGGDGWAYDIGFGGLDHVMSLTDNINILVLDTQCYSNTGGQQSKATPMGAVSKFADLGKHKARKDLGVSVMMYGHVYVAQVALGSQLNQTLKALQEAEAYDGPSLVIAYSPCEEHGYDLAKSHEQMKDLVKSGFWPLYRYDPRRAAEGKPGLILDSKSPNSEALSSILLKEQRFRRLETLEPQVANMLHTRSTKMVESKYRFLQMLASYSDIETPPDS